MQGDESVPYARKMKRFFLKAVEESLLIAFQVSFEFGNEILENAHLRFVESVLSDLAFERVSDNINDQNIVK